MKKVIFIFFCAIISAFSYSQISPQQLSGLQLWLKADSLVLLNGNFVTQWSDCSGNGYNAVQDDIQKKPVFIDSTSCLNSKPVIHFDGLDDVLNGVTIQGINNSSLSFFAVVNGDYQSNNSINKAMILGIGSTDGLWIYRNIFPSQERFEVSNYNLTGYAPNLSAPNNGFDCKIIDYNKEINYYQEFYINTLYSYLPGTPLTFNNGDYYLGNNSYPGQIALNGDIAEIILYNRVLADNERLQILKYIDKKYGATVNLGADISSDNFCTESIDAGPCFTNYIWSTGATTQSIDVNTGGIYSITVTDIFGFTSFDTIIINKPIVTISYDTLCMGDSAIIHSGLSTPYLSLWEWNGDSIYSEDYLIHSADTVMLHVFDTSGCSVNFPVVMYQDSFSITNLLCAPNLIICAGDTIFPCTGSSQITTYNWFDGISNYSTPYFIVPVSWAATGSHDLWLTCTNTLGCTASDMVAVSVPGQVPVAAFNATAGCDPFLNSFTDFSLVQGTGDIVNTWVWNFNDGDSAFVQNPVHSFNDTGIHLVTLTVTTNHGCSMTVTDTAFVYSNPDPVFSPLLGCSGIPLQFNDQSTNILGNINSWIWDFNDPYSSSNISTMQSPIHTFDSIGYYWVQLTVTSVYGCTSTDSALVHIRPSPNIDFSYTTVCEGSPVFFFDETIDNLGIYQLYWNIDGSIFTISNPVYTFNGSGIFPVTLHEQSVNGCAAELTEYVEVFPNPVAELIVTPVCVGVPYTFYDSSYTVTSDTISTWLWDFGDGTSQSMVQNPSHVYANVGNYNIVLIVQTINGCKDSVSYNISVLNNPSAAVITQIGDALYSNSVIGNQWYNESGLIVGATSQSYTPTDTGYYFVIVTYSIACVSDTSNIIFYTYNGIHETSALPEIIIYPNPTGGVFNLEISAPNAEIISISIINCLGMEIYCSAKTCSMYGKYKTVIDLRSYSEGIYSVAIKIGNYNLTKKLSIIRN